MLPSASLDASAPRRRVFSRLNTQPTCPLSTLHSRPYVRLRMTRGRCGSLFLHRMRLSLTISRRSSPAHRGLTPYISPKKGEDEGVRATHFTKKHEKSQQNDSTRPNCRRVNRSAVMQRKENGTMPNLQ
jgi:hypothetical protein